MDAFERELERWGVTCLGGRATGRTGGPILLLHGLMGRGRAWAPHFGWLRDYGRVYTLDAAWHRGRNWRDTADHAATRPPIAPASTSTQAPSLPLPGEGDPAIATERFVADAAAALEAIGEGPATVVGHSMGGLHAWCLAAARPDLVRAVVVEDMGPDFRGWTTGAWDAWSDSWPVEFTRERALEMFGEVAGGYFLDSFDRIRPRSDGEPPRWRLHGHVPVWRAIANHWGTRDYWGEWARVRCPALLIEAQHTIVPEGQMRAMTRVDRPAPTRYIRVEGAGHLVQSDAPHEYRGAVEAFLAES